MSDTTDEGTALKAKVAALESALHQNNLSIAVAFKLTPALSNLLGLLIALPLVTPETIQHKLRLSADPKVAMHRLRRMMARWWEGPEPLIKGRRCVGYWIEPKDKEWLQSKIEAVTQ